MIGQKLNKRYAITARLGTGGMGEVYQATDEQTAQQVAVKILASQLITNPESLERFRREAETLRQLDHPNIVKFVDAFEYEGQYVIVMEFVSGGSLFELLRHGPLPIERTRQIALDLCDALIRAHRLNIIHRDLKPENVLLNQNGIPKLADFGVARLSEGTRMTRTGTQVGTPYYMSPEAWEGKMLDAQADIWSLGVVLFEMLAGHVPFNGDTPLAVMNKVFTAQPPDLKKLRAEVPMGVIKIIRLMLTRDRKKRYQSMREVAVDLERGQQATTPVPVRARDSQARAASNLGWRMWAVIGVVTALALVGVGSIAGTVIKNRPTVLSTRTGPLAIGSTLASDKDGQTLFYVPAGAFTMGSTTGDPDEQPVQTLALDAFWIDRTEVTNAMYSKCVDAKSCKPPSNTEIFNYPSHARYAVVFVDWNHANAYCAWADRRLPTEAEWEKAARGPDGYTYPWGNSTPTNDLLNFSHSVNTNYSSGLSNTMEVGKYPQGASPYGALDMAGGVWEWVSSLYKPYPYDASDGRENLSSTAARVLRGGSWNDNSEIVRSANRFSYPQTSSSFVTGFRCARTAP